MLGGVDGGEEHLLILDSTDLDAFCERTLDEVYRYALRLTGGDPARTGDLVEETYSALLRHCERRRSPCTRIVPESAARFLVTRQPKRTFNSPPGLFVRIGPIAVTARNVQLERRQTSERSGILATADRPISCTG